MFTLAGFTHMLCYSLSSFTKSDSTALCYTLYSCIYKEGIWCLQYAVGSY